MRYKGVVIRPPSEAESYLLQVTYGCSRNTCAFCGTYPKTGFKARPAREVFEDIESAGKLMPYTRRVFLCDGNAMVLSTRKLLEILEALRKAFPQLERVGVYSNDADALGKAPGELEELRESGLGIAYLGLESGSNEILRRVNKQASPQSITDAVLRLKAAGIRTSVIAILGLGGSDLSEDHVRGTAEAVNRMQPDYFSLLTLMLVPGTPLCEDALAGRFRLKSPVEMVEELRDIIRLLELEKTVFRTNHASNFAPVKGTLSEDKAEILRTLDLCLSGCIPLKPEWMRGL